MAEDYDAIYATDDDGARCARYRTLIDRHGAPGDRLVDLGCGTGKGTLHFAEAGFSVTGVDCSTGMLKVAAAKPGASTVRFVPGDLRELPELDPFDVAVMLGGPLNYLHDERELRAAFDGVYRLLRPDGLFLFDLYTLGLRESLLSGPWVHESPGGMVVMRGYPADERLMEVQVDHFSSGDARTWNRTTFRQPQFHLPLATAGRLLDASGLTLIAHHGLALNQEELLPGAGDRDHMAVLAVARKDAASPARQG
nr:class I SAM-dependent methyltransferase [Streptomyces sp. HNM0574]